MIDAEGYHPEQLRRALDLKSGRRGRAECRSAVHRDEVEMLSHLSAKELRRRLVEMHVRIDPPARERMCSCEVDA